MKHIFVCEGTQEGIFTAVYEAFYSGIPRDDISLQTEGEFEYNLFCEYTYVKSDGIKAFKVIDTLKKRFSAEVNDNIFYAILSGESDRADVIYKFIVKLFKYGDNVIYNIGDEVIARIFDLNRNVSREAHHFLGFLRFEEIENGILYAVYSPKNRITPILAGHFADRLNTENFIIVDNMHREAAFYSKQTGIVLRMLEDSDMKDMLNVEADVKGHINSSDSFKRLWSVFFNSVNIKERENIALQRNNIPLRFRTYMPEFNETEKNCKNSETA